MKKAVAFLLAFLIFVAPVTTFVKADVVIGDNDDIIVNENASILGRKLAMLESLSELALSGVTEYTISNTEDVDSYLDSLWSEVNDAIDYLDSGEWVSDIPSNIASKYYTNLVKYRDIVNNRGEFLGFDLQNPATSLLKTYFANDIYGKKYTSTNLYNSLDTFRALSSVRGGGGNSPDIPIDFSFVENINKLFLTQQNFLEYDKNYIKSTSNDPTYYLYYPINELTITGDFSNGNHLPTGTGGYNGLKIGAIYPNITINVTTNSDESATVSYSNTTNANWFYNSWGSARYNMNLTSYNQSTGEWWAWLENSGLAYTPVYTQTQFAGLSTAINYIYQHYSNINLYVNGEPWVIISNNNSSPTLDIDGLLKIFGNDNHVQYELQPNTQIDYDELYQVIYNAIRDNLPISQGDINYYDSHDTIYSPTIINNYGEEEGNESDLIDTILDYAVIPKFDTAIAQPMREALTNGVVIMNNSITNVIPDEILLILGACFFLLLFAVVINRMIK